MRTYVKKAPVIVIALAVLVVTFLFTRESTVRATKSPIQDTPAVINKTKSLEVLDSHIVQIGEHNFVEFKVKNIGQKSVAIVAFDRYTDSDRQAGFQRLSWLTESLDTPLLAPRETSPPALVVLDGAQAHVAALIFEDGTGEGDPNILKLLREQFAYYKKGIRYALDRARAQLVQVERGAKSSNAVLAELQAEMTEIGGHTDQPMMSSNGYLAAASALRKASKKGRGLVQLREAVSEIERAAQ